MKLKNLLFALTVGVDKMENEAAKAPVMSHEVAHVIARHGGETLR